MSLPAIDDDIAVARFLDNGAAAGRAVAADLYGAHSIFRFDPQTERRADDDADIWFGPRFDNTAAARSGLLDDVIVRQCGTHHRHEPESYKKCLHLVYSMNDSPRLSSMIDLRVSSHSRAAPSGSVPPARAVMPTLILWSRRMNDAVLARVAALKSQPVPNLKQQWRDLFETEPPPYNRRFLTHRHQRRRRQAASANPHSFSKQHHTARCASALY